ncbi:MAG TPA: NADP-dependent oxidoreductase [Polyangiaceae bacterium]|jgi:NADPH:quinone reductase-like Zn-dependent oxidoreductase
MQAIVLSEYGDPNQLELRDRPEPEPGAGQIKVRVASAGLNPLDWKLRSGALQKVMPLELPAILGRDAAGEVVRVGPGVTEFKEGEHVLGLVNGGYAQFVVAAAEAWAKIPEGLSTKDAGALPLALLTGDQLTEATLGPSAGAGLTVLVTGALGAVGRVAVWGIRQRGARVLAGVRGKQLGEAKSLGMDDVVALDDPSALAALPTLDCVADTVGGQTIAQLLPKLSASGTIGSVVGEPQGAKERGLLVSALLSHPDSARLAQLAAAVAEGSLEIPIAKRFPLAEAPAAHALAERGGIGKILLMPFA